MERYASPRQHLTGIDHYKRIQSSHAGEEAELKTGTLMVVLLLVQLLIHPVVHVPLSPGLSTPEMYRLPERSNSQAQLGSLSPCLGCRTAANLLATPLATEALGVSPSQESVRFQPVPYHSQDFNAAVSSRAPPLA